MAATIKRRQVKQNHENSITDIFLSIYSTLQFFVLMGGLSFLAYVLFLVFLEEVAR